MSDGAPMCRGPTYEQALEFLKKLEAIDLSPLEFKVRFELPNGSHR